MTAMLPRHRRCEERLWALLVCDVRCAMCSGSRLPAEHEWDVPACANGDAELRKYNVHIDHIERT